MLGFNNYVSLNSNLTYIYTTETLTTPNIDTAERYDPLNHIFFFLVNFEMF